MQALQDKSILMINSSVLKCFYGLNSFKLFLFLALYFYGFFLKAQHEILEGSVKSVQLFNPSSNNLSPFIKPNQKLILTFDYIETYPETFYYEIVHYDANWRKSTLPRNIYLKGINYPRFKIPQNSFNTTIDFTHYTLEVPNEKQKILISGNFSIDVYKQGDRELIFSKRFSIYETQTTFKMNWERITHKNKDKQRIETEVSSPIIENDANPNNYTFSIIKNYNWKDALYNLRPTFFTANGFAYNSFDIAFDGGDEYFTFDTKIINLPNIYVEKVNNISGLFESKLRPIDLTNKNKYLLRFDVNGQFFFRTISQFNELTPYINADYSLVHFKLLHPKENKKIAVTGMFNDWEKPYELEYNIDTGFWEGKYWLKQGYYNYKFINADGGKSIHGNFWETENNYTSLFYYRKPTENFDRLIGLKEIRTNRQ